MSTLTIRLPDDKHERLCQLAKHHNMSLNKLIEELSTVALAQFDTEMRFRTLVAKGSVEEALRILDKLDKAFKLTVRLFFCWFSEFTPNLTHQLAKK
jgi:predicted transcriptional regulator